MPIYALGSNGSGQLGLGHEEDVSEPRLVRVPETLTADRVRTVTAGGNHTLLLCTSGDVYASGSNVNGRCGIIQERMQLSTFEQVDLPGKVKLCAATWDASIFALEDGRIMVCGAGAKGELGLGRGHNQATKPTDIAGFPPKGATVIDLAACMGHVIIVLSNGDAYGWGTGRHGQIGEPAEDVWQPRKIENVSFKVARAICGKDFSCLLSDPTRGQVLLMGPSKRDLYNLKGSIPARVDPWIDTQASWGSVFMHMSSGQLLSWGRNDHGQLAPPNVPNVTSIAAGSEHMLALTAAGQVLAWGWGEHGNCGSPLDGKSDVNGRWNTLEVNGQVIRLGAGCATSWIVVSDSKG